MKTLHLTAVLEREGDGYVSLCPELDVASQGTTVEEALANLREAVELFLECADAAEIKARFKGGVYRSQHREYRDDLCHSSRARKGVFDDGRAERT